MKIAFIYDLIYPYSKGGVERRNWELATRLAKRGHEVHIFGMKCWDGPDTILKKDAYIHGVCQPKELFVTGRRSITEAIYFAWRLLPHLFKNRFDIIDCQNTPYFPCFSAKLHSLLKKSHLVITWHEVWDDYWYVYLGRKGMFGIWVERIVAHLTDKVIAVSERTKRNLEMIGVNKKIRVIPNGINFEEIARVKEAEVKSDIIFVGRLIKDKNVDVLIKAITLLKKNVPDIKCLLLGEGPERTKLEESSHDLQADKTIKFMGFLEDYNDVISNMKSSKVFVLPSTREGFGIVVLEANACGLPVVTVSHKRNAACDLISNGNGFICELSEEDIAEKIVIGLKKTTEMKQKCIESAKRYDWDSISTLVESFYESLR